jgi:hypothetical protein
MSRKDQYSRNCIVFTLTGVTLFLVVLFTIRWELGTMGLSGFFLLLGYASHDLAKKEKE